MNVAYRNQKLSGTKAETLAELASSGFPVPRFTFFTVEEWRQAPEACLEKIAMLELSPDAKLAIRSSAVAEDGIDCSQAGVYDSVLNVRLDGRADICLAIDSVVRQFSDMSDQVLVQEMKLDIDLSGVATTHVLVDGSPYYVMNYDDVSGRTDTVTGGKGAVKTVYVYRGARKEYFDSHRLRIIVEMIQRLENHFAEAPLDIEFVVDKSLDIHLLQVRYLATSRHWKDAFGRRVTDHMPFLAKFIEECTTPRVGLFGRRTMLGVMPDWNPAEMIGVAPRPLAFSLYRELITRRVWSLARRDMGYRRLPPVELMLSLGGRPYIDVRASFNSFLPDGLPGTTAEMLANAWLDRLDKNPELHDKIEFGVVHTMAEFGLRESVSERYPGLLSDADLGRYVSLLRRLTNNALLRSGTLHSALDTVKKLCCDQEKKLYVERDTAQDMTPLDLALRVSLAIEKCRESGTLPFAIIARHAFIAESLLRSASGGGALDCNRIAGFKKSFKTIAGELTEDFARVLSGSISRAEFLRSYGHLRPGTYDILSPCYADRSELFEGTSGGGPTEVETEAHFALTSAETAKLDALIREERLETNAAGLLEYAKAAICGREYAKFIFTRHVSHILDLLVVWGGKLGLSREDLSMLPIGEMLETLHKPFTAETGSYFAERVAFYRDEYESGRAFAMAYLIRSERDMYIVPQHRSAPNFITRKRLSAPVVHLDGGATMTEDLLGKIVCIESADPGYDWVFTRGIVGLVTCYGGVNSHMAIRCAEYDLPAAIGCGELGFDKLRSAASCLLDCGAKEVTPLTGGRETKW